METFSSAVNHFFLLIRIVNHIKEHDHESYWESSCESCHESCCELYSVYTSVCVCVVCVSVTLLKVRVRLTHRIYNINKAEWFLQAWDSTLIESPPEPPWGADYKSVYHDPTWSRMIPRWLQVTAEGSKAGGRMKHRMIYRRRAKGSRNGGWLDGSLFRESTWQNHTHTRVHKHAHTHTCTQTHTCWSEMKLGETSGSNLTHTDFRTYKD